MKIALATVRIIDRDIYYNLMQMERYMKEAKAKMGASADGKTINEVAKEIMGL